MQNNCFNTNQYPCSYPQLNPNAVNINIVSPQAYGSTAPMTCPINQNQNAFYSLYGQNQNPNLPIYPQNYNNLGANPQQTYPNGYEQNTTNAQQTGVPNYNNALPNNNLSPQNQNLENENDLNNKTNMSSETNLFSKTDVANEANNKEANKTKKIIPLTDDYIKSLENYMNNENPKVRLIGAKEVLERYKEDENRKDNPSLTPLLNKALKDTNSAVRFLALTTLQLGYAVGNDETVSILKEIQSQNNDKVGEDALLASEILLNMSAGKSVEVPMTQKEIDEQNRKAKKKDDK